MIGSIGLQEIFLVFILALLLYGGRLPEIFKKLAKSYKNLRKIFEEIKEDIRKELQNQE